MQDRLTDEQIERIEGRATYHGGDGDPDQTVELAPHEFRRLCAQARLANATPPAPAVDEEAVRLLLRDVIFHVERHTYSRVDWKKDVLDPLRALLSLASQRGETKAAWSHGCNALLQNIELWIDACPHCGMPRSAAPATKEA